MQSALNRQAMTGEVNPLFKKFVHEGDNPTTYIPADKRREIYDYMSKVNFTKHLESKYPFCPSNDLASGKQTEIITLTNSPIFVFV